MSIGSIEYRNLATVPDDATAGCGWAELRTGWPLLVAATLGIALGFPTLAVYSLGVFAPELAREFNWSYAEIMHAMILTNIVLLFSSPLMGSLCDRIGVRPVVLTSSALLGVCFMAFAFSKGDLGHYYWTWLIMSVSAAGAAGVTWTRAIHQHFHVHRGLAIGIALSGTGLFAVLGKLLAGSLITAIGWRNAYIAMGILPIVLVVPVGYWGLRSLAKPREGVDSKSHNLPPALSLHQALRHRRFWTMAVAFLPMGFALGGPVPNLENLLHQHEFSRAEILTITPWLGITMIIGRLGGGWLADRVWVPMLACGLLGFTAIGCIILSQPEVGYATAVLAVLLLGTAIGAEIDLASYMVARYLGVKHYGLLYGLLYGMIALGGGMAPSVFAWSFDSTGSYSGVLLANAIGLIVPGVLLLTLGAYPRAEGTPSSGIGRR